MKPVRVTGTLKYWVDLNHKTITNDCVVLSQIHELGDPSYVGPTIYTQKVIVDQCDKNFVYYRVNSKKTFPCLQSVYLGSHPCEPIVIHMLRERDIDVFLHQRWYGYLDRWGIKGVDLITSDEYEKIIGEPEEFSVTGKT